MADDSNKRNQDFISRERRNEPKLSNAQLESARRKGWLVVDSTDDKGVTGKIEVSSLSASLPQILSAQSTLESRHDTFSLHTLLFHINNNWGWSVPTRSSCLPPWLPAGFSPTGCQWCRQYAMSGVSIFTSSSPLVPRGR